MSEYSQALNEVTKYMSMIKLLSPHHAFETIKKAMIWMGVYGYTKECPLEMGFRGLFSYCIGAEGALNIQRVVIVRELLGREFI